ncbi:hypothetical protein [Vagococcus zengguangii]|uniref:hypothetical protein n=1 Tax=Vagococcus zengguangii TaxID=2571750 RepID=UPI0011093FF5|nr:hypothetical protein [Vagococcus zengguangii]TLG81417.1 hypothetical protein FE258_02755 [Vagococcus zengguangii]
MEGILNLYVSHLSSEPLLWVVVTVLIIFGISMMTRFIDIDFLDLSFVWIIMITLFVFLDCPWWLAFIAGLIAAFLLKIAIIFPFREKMSYSTIISSKELVGKDGELMTSLNVNETGQVRLILSSGIENFPCKMMGEQSTTLARGEKVRVISVDEKNNLIYITKLVDHNWDEF